MRVPEKFSDSFFDLYVQRELYFVRVILCNIIKKEKFVTLIEIMQQSRILF